MGCLFTESRLFQSHFEAALKKLGSQLRMLEQETHYLSSMQTNDDHELVSLLSKIVTELNAHDESTLVLEGYTLRLKVVRAKPTPPEVKAYHVPLLLADREFLRRNCDLTAKKVFRAVSILMCPNGFFFIFQHRN